MMDGVLFEHRSNGEIWRIHTAEYEGRPVAHLRKWYRGEDGELRPTKTGVAFVHDRLHDLYQALTEWVKDNPRLPCGDCFRGCLTVDKSPFFSFLHLLTTQIL